ncbi:MAG TPA: hypothetical protein VMR16_02520, partial [Candidatus Saccharimonadales bacterium]|nr:hypothetical protein [Candidatus Saccharimonadales bacterium]
MDQVILYVVLGVVVVGFAILIYVVNQRLGEQKNSSAVTLLKSDVTELSRVINSLQESVGNKLERNNTTMQTSMQKQLTESP